MDRALRGLAMVALLCTAPALGQAPGPAPAPRPTLPSLLETKVVLGWDDFKKLVESTFDEERVIPPPPQSFAVDAVSYQGEMRKGFLAATAKVEVTVLEREQWVSVPLWGGVAVTAARGIAAGDALVFDGSRHQLLARGAGRRAFEVDFVVGGGDRPGQNTLAFQTPGASVSHIRVVASADVEKVEATSLVGAVTSAEGKEILGAVPQTGQVALTYYLPLAKEAEGPGEVVTKEPKVLVEELTLATVGDELLSLSTTYRYQVLHAPVTAFRFKVPDGVEVLEATGENLVEGFKILKTDAGRELEARVGFEVKGGYELTVRYEREVAGTATSADLSLLEPLGVERATGIVGFEVEASAEVAASGVERMVPLDVSEVPQEIWAKASRPLLMGFRYLARPFKLALAITRHEDLPVKVATCDRAFVTILLTEDGDVLGRGIYYLRNNRKSFLEVELPAGAEIWSVQVSGRAEKPSTKEGQKGRILVKLPRSADRPEAGAAPAGQTPAFPVEIVYFQESSPVGRVSGALELATPVVDVPVSELGLSLWLPAERAYHFVSGTLRPQLQTGGIGPGAGFALPRFGLPGYRSAAPAAPAPTPHAEGFAYQQMQEDQAFKGKMDRKAPEKTAGSLPVPIAFPEEGVNLRFRELLQIEEPGTVRITYVHAFVRRAVELLCGLLGLATGILLALAVARRLATGTFSLSRAAWAVLGASLVAIALGSLLLDVPLATFTATLLPAMVLTALVLAARRVVQLVAGGRRAGTTSPPSPPPPPPTTTSAPAA